MNDSKKFTEIMTRIDFGYIHSIYKKYQKSKAISYNCLLFLKLSSEYQHAANFKYFFNWLSLKNIQIHLDSAILHRKFFYWKHLYILKRWKRLYFNIHLRKIIDNYMEKVNLFHEIRANQASKSILKRTTIQFPNYDFFFQANFK